MWEMLVEVVPLGFTSIHWVYIFMKPLVSFFELQVECSKVLWWLLMIDACHTPSLTSPADCWLVRLPTSGAKRSRLCVGYFSAHLPRSYHGGPIEWGTVSKGECFSFLNEYITEGIMVIWVYFVSCAAWKWTCLSVRNRMSELGLCDLIACLDLMSRNMMLQKRCKVMQGFWETMNDKGMDYFDQTHSAEKSCRALQPQAQQRFAF